MTSEEPMRGYSMVELEKINIPDMVVNKDIRDSIDDIGLKYPPIIEPAEDSDERYDIVDGRRRLVAVDDLGWDKVKAFIQIGPEHDDLTPVVLNTQRSPNPALEYQIISEKLEGDMTQTELSDKLGISQPKISKRMKLGDLIQQFFDALAKERLSPNKGYKLAKLSEERQTELYDEYGEDITFDQIQESRREEVTEDLDMEQIEDVPDPDDIDKEVEEDDLIYECSCSHKFFSLVKDGGELKVRCERCQTLRPIEEIKDSEILTEVE